MRRAPTGASLRQLCLGSQVPYLGLLQEWGALLILDVCDLAFLDLETGSWPVIL